uniref:Alpha-1,2-Mannosidase n=1 Tax=Acrobeloides nanus TaxID=290746 RepID=A0A914DVW8_9BILA
MAATIIDAADTLWIMGDKAKSIADVLLKSFDTTTGIPKSLLNPSTGVASNYQIANHSSILAEFGTLHLEFAYLTEVTNEPIYLKKVQKIRDILDKAEKSEGLYPSFMSPETGKFTYNFVTVGALADSFYEYLIKSWILSGKSDEQALKMHKSASDAIQNKGKDHAYLLRPEVLESFFYLWRLTRKQKYREWVWDGISAIEKHCRIKTGGYSGLKNVYKPKEGHDDIQQSFFLAETLKYAYLTFADDSIPLDRWVFNTEAHPLPIKNAPINP